MKIIVPLVVFATSILLNGAALTEDQWNQLSLSFWSGLVGTPAPGEASETLATRMTKVGERIRQLAFMDGVVQAAPNDIPVENWPPVFAPVVQEQADLNWAVPVGQGLDVVFPVTGAATGNTMSEDWSHATDSTELFDSTEVFETRLPLS